MSFISTIRKIFVASDVAGLSAAVQKLLPTIEVVNLSKNASGGLSASDRSLVEWEAEVLLADVPDILSVIYSAKHLKWVQSTWAGVEKLLAGLNHTSVSINFLRSFQQLSMTPVPCLLTRTGGAFNKIMAEYVLGYVLAHERSIIEVFQEQQACTWSRSKFDHYRSLSELTIGILGVGEIGSEVARLCHASGMRVIGVTRTPPSEDRKCPAVSVYRTISELPSVLQECDYVCNVLPSTAHTQGLLAGQVFSHCQKKKSVFINIGRGDITNEESLVKAIKEGWIGGAVLDVFPEEPLPSTSPLWGLPGVKITPHISGVSLPSQVAESFRANFQRLLDDKTLKFQVDVDRGY